jgi:hypothetical protein
LFDGEIRGASAHDRSFGIIERYDQNILIKNRLRRTHLLVTGPGHHALVRFVNQEKIMINKSALALFAAVAAVGIASPALAQSFDKTDGTGNELPAYYDADGGLHFGTAPQSGTITVHTNGLHAFAQVQRTPFAFGSTDRRTAKDGMG